MNSMPSYEELLKINHALGEKFRNWKPKSKR